MDYPALKYPALWRDGNDIRGNMPDPGPGPWFAVEQVQAVVQEAIAADRAQRAAPGVQVDEPPQGTGYSAQAFLDLARLYCAVTETPSGDLEWSFRQRDIENLAAEIATQQTPPAAAEGVPEGWQLVPSHPTLQMIDAACEIDARAICVEFNKARYAAAGVPGGDYATNGQVFVEQYQAALAAAPEISRNTK